MTGSKIRRVCGKSIGWSCGWVVCWWDKGITYGGGHCGWFGAWNVCGHHVGGLRAVVGVIVGAQRSCWEQRGARGLQLLTTNVSSSLSSSSSVRIWKGLLCCVKCWYTIGNQLIVHCVMMVLDVFSTLGGAAIATLGGKSVSTLGDVGRGGGKLGWPDIIVESWQIVARCLNFGTAHSRDCTSELVEEVCSRY
jgi:hypothetical protein